MTFLVTVYELEGMTDEGFSGSIEIDRVEFDMLDDALDWADDSGYLDHTAYGVEVVDEHGNQTWL